METARASRIMSWLLLGLACAVAFGAGRGLGVLAPSLTLSSAVAEETVPAVTFTVRPVDVGGLQGGELLAEDRTVFLIAVPAGGLKGYERALIVADRLNRQIAAGAQGVDFTTSINGEVGTFVHQSTSIIFTVTPDDARHAGVTVPELTNTWAQSIWSVLPGPPSPPDLASPSPTTQPQTQTQTASSEWVPEEPYEDKYVPVLSILRGVRVGVARVNGPKSKIDMTQAVGQLELKFRDVLDIEVYIPISTKEPGKTLARVQSVGVTGLGDLKL